MASIAIAKEAQTITWTDDGIATVNGWPVEVCQKCGGTGYLPGYEYSDGARCWGCMTQRFTTAKGTEVAIARIAAARIAGTTPDVAAEKARALADQRKVIDRRTKARVRAAAKREAAWAAKAAAAAARRDQIAATFEGHPAAVDATYWGNLLEGGAPDWQIAGYAWAAAAWEQAQDVTDDMIAKAEATTAKLTAPAAPPLQPGRQVITGTAGHPKEHTSYFGYRETTTWKFVVTTDTGQRVYGTIPDALWDNGIDGIQGRRVTFTATVDPKGDDPTFGFYSRPTKASYLPTPAAPVVAL